MVGLWFGFLKGREEIHIEMEEQMFGEYILRGHLNNKVAERTWVKRLLQAPLSPPALTRAQSVMLAPR